MCDIQKICNALFADDICALCIPEGKVRDLFRTLYIEKIPAVLMEHLDRRVTLVSLVAARLAIARFVVKSDFSAQIIPHLPGDYVTSPQDVEKEIAVSRECAEDDVVKLECALAQAENLPEGTETTELFGPQSVLRDLCSRGIDPATLTIRDLIEQNPVAIIV